MNIGAFGRLSTLEYNPMFFFAIASCYNMGKNKELNYYEISFDLVISFELPRTPIAINRIMVLPIIQAF